MTHRHFLNVIRITKEVNKHIDKKDLDINNVQFLTKVSMQIVSYSIMYDFATFKSMIELLCMYSIV